MTHSRIPEYLRHMLVSSNQIIRFLGDATESEFDANLMMQKAILYAFLSIGEAAVRVRLEDAGFITRNGMEGLNSAIALRNRLAHEYDRIDVNITWRAAKESVPPLRQKLIDVLFTLGHNPDPDSLHF